jgi:hypothetical protein
VIPARRFSEQARKSRKTQKGGWRRHRLAWRRDQVLVHSRRVLCCTYDEMLADLRQRIRMFARAAGVDGP